MITALKTLFGKCTLASIVFAAAFATASGATWKGIPAALAKHPRLWKHEKIGEIEYWLYTPKSVRPGAKLMVHLPGCFADAESYKRFGNFTQAAEKFGMVLAIADRPETSWLEWWAWINTHQMLPGNPMPGCWDALASNNIVQAGRHTDMLILMIEALLARPDLSLNKSNVLISGHSSGATQAVALACSRPDLISGIGLASGPLLGTGVDEAYTPRVTSQQSLSICQSLSQGRAGFERQKAVLIVSDVDWAVNPAHTSLSFEMLKSLYGATRPVALDLNQLPGTKKEGSGQVVMDDRGAARVTAIVQTDLGHNWPSGVPSNADDDEDDSGFNFESIDYPLFMSEFLK